MKRRELMGLVGGAAVAWPMAARAQQQPRVWRVGYLAPSSPSDINARTNLETLRLKLRELGYVEGRNLILYVRRAEGDFSRLPDLAAELVALRADVIVATATPAVSAAQRATSAIPIVMGPTADPIGSGFIKSLANRASTSPGSHS
jgi:putative ABC transport system substrate-binding protein